MTTLKVACCSKGFLIGVLIVLGLASGQANAQTFTTLASFDGTNGEYPRGSLTLSGSTLYGMTSHGGVNDLGAIVSIPVNGGSLTTLHSFNGTNGARPLGRLTLSGSTLYGMTSDWGTPLAFSQHYGSIFSIPVGGGPLTTLHSFNGTDGRYPNGCVTLSLDESTLYGMALGDHGTIFSMPASGGPLTTLHSFSGADGSSPLGSLTLSPDGSTLYGMTLYGGANGMGNIFSIPASGGSLTTLLSFDGPNGDHPNGSLTLSPDGSTLYGMTHEGGATYIDNFEHGDGSIFSILVGGGPLTTLHSFNGTNGKFPLADLTLSPDGAILYGTTDLGGVNDRGTIFNIPVDGGSLTTLHSFNGADGKYPEGSLTFGPDKSTLYGMTFSGGASNDGTVFSLTVPEPSTFVLFGTGGIVLAGWMWRRRRSLVVAPELR